MAFPIPSPIRVEGTPRMDGVQMTQPGLHGWSRKARTGTAPPKRPKDRFSETHRTPHPRRGSALRPASHVIGRIFWPRDRRPRSGWTDRERWERPKTPGDPREAKKEHPKGLQGL